MGETHWGDQDLQTMPPLTTGPLVLYGEGSFLLALCLLALAVVAVRPAVPGADGPIGAVAGDAIAGAAGGATPVEAHGAELAFVPALVCKGEKDVVLSMGLQAGAMWGLLTWGRGRRLSGSVLTWGATPDGKAAPEWTPSKLSVEPHSPPTPKKSTAGRDTGVEK